MNDPDPTLADMRGHQWADLNDVFAAGDLEVWYMSPNHFRDGICGAKPDRNNLGATHIKLGAIAPCPSGPSSSPERAAILKTLGQYSVNELDEVWQKLQGEFWSPNGEARTMLRALGLKHTSMSVGDCFRFANGEVWIVAAVGFELVK
jgi:hypothetical protein